MRKEYISGIAVMGALLVLSMTAGTARAAALTVQVDRPGTTISPTLHG
ncbi:MAG: hypothetical protein JO112_03470, partial [Planctomycetes bacterium]|nr:hypothetical protein [Planctomycetota bacterium]